MENPERRARVAEEKRIMDAILTLHERHERMGATQEELAHALDVSRTTVFDMEHKRHTYTSTIGSYVEALGGKLELCAIFPDQTIRLGPIDPNYPGGARRRRPSQDSYRLGLSASWLQGRPWVANCSRANATS